MLHGHSSIHVLLSVVIAILGSWTALDLYGRVRARRGTRHYGWLAATALAMGLSIWSMHFVAMLGFNAGVPVTYDVGLTLLSLLLAIIPTAAAFAARQAGGVSPGRLATAAFAMGSGICLMHYVGMAALRAPATLDYSYPLVLLSFLIAVGASAAALVAVQRDHSVRYRLVGAALLGLAICAMHYTAMAAASFTPTHAAMMGAGDLGNSALTFAVANSTLLLLLLALGAAMFDRRFETLAVMEAEARVRRESEAQLSAIFAQAAAGMSEVSLDFRFVRVNDELCRMLGRSRDELLGMEIDAVTFEADRESSRRAGERVRASGVSESIDKRYVHSDGTIVWASVNIARLDDENGAPRAMLAVVMDLSERKRAEEHQLLLLNELNHRVKNTLAIVQGFAHQSFRSKEVPAPVRETFEGRLAALSAAHNLLTRQNWEAASLRQVAAETIEIVRPAGCDVIIEGPELTLMPRTAVSVAMAIHELATNALKYGSFARPGGRVEVEWSLDGERLRLVWRERGGPPVSAPARRGFGTRMIERALATELAGEARIDFAPEGLVCTVEAAWPPARGRRSAG